MTKAIQSFTKGIVLAIVTVAITPILVLSELVDAFNSMI
jgi:hypothetical protein